MYLGSVYFQLCVFSIESYLDNFILKLSTSFNFSVTNVLGNQIKPPIWKISKLKFSDFGLRNKSSFDGAVKCWSPKVINHFMVYSSTGCHILLSSTDVKSMSEFNMMT